MKPKTEQLLQKAAQSIAAANLLLQGAQPEFAAARSYYAMFYVAEARCLRGWSAQSSFPSFPSGYLR